MCRLSGLICAMGILAGTFSALAEETPKVLQFKMKSIDGEEIDLSKYEGKVLLIVNVASRCGYTGQYKGLQAIHEKYEKDGLVVLGVPCNQFGKQEPGTEEEIKEFCTSKYNVDFDMFAKVDVNGDDACDLYKYLTSEEAVGDKAGAVRWNFEKFLVSRDGKVVGRYPSKIAPESETLVSAVEAELAKK